MPRGWEHPPSAPWDGKPFCTEQVDDTDKKEAGFHVKLRSEAVGKLQVNRKKLPASLLFEYIYIYI